MKLYVYWFRNRKNSETRENKTQTSEAQKCSKYGKMSLGETISELESKVQIWGPLFKLVERTHPFIQH